MRLPPPLATQTGCRQRLSHRHTPFNPRARCAALLKLDVRVWESDARRDDLMAKEKLEINLADEATEPADTADVRALGDGRKVEVKSKDGKIRLSCIVRVEKRPNW